RLFRIIITAGIWLAMNAHILYGGYIPEFILSLRSTCFSFSLSWIDTVELSSNGRSMLFIDPPSFSFLTDISRN
ncbi:hypothetical protein Q604_UNBC09303G0001, partial [human gut metagenome]